MFIGNPRDGIPLEVDCLCSSTGSETNPHASKNFLQIMPASAAIEIRRPAFPQYF